MNKNRYKISRDTVHFNIKIVTVGDNYLRPSSPMYKIISSVGAGEGGGVRVLGDPPQIILGFEPLGSKE
jgi:hypothetical protein